MSGDKKDASATAALALFNQALQVEPGNVDAWLGKARCLELG
jgi:hypothetical protein